MVSSYSPFTGRFKLKVGDLQIGTFQQATGLSAEIDASFEIKEGGNNEFVHRMPGRIKWPNLVLKRGMTTGDELFSWLRQTSGEGFSGQRNVVPRKDVTLEMLNADGSKLRGWTFLGAFPVKWKGPEFTTDSSSVATEELELAHHGIRIDS